LLWARASKELERHRIGVGVFDERINFRKQVGRTFGKRAVSVDTAAELVSVAEDADVCVAKLAGGERVGLGVSVDSLHFLIFGICFGERDADVILLLPFFSGFARYPWSCFESRVHSSCTRLPRVSFDFDLDRLSRRIYAF
jgi:hypothetical protein